MFSRRRFLQAGTITAGAALAAIPSSLQAEDVCSSAATVDRQPEVHERPGQADHRG